MKERVYEWGEDENFILLILYIRAYRHVKGTNLDNKQLPVRLLPGLLYVKYAPFKIPNNL